MGFFNPANWTPAQREAVAAAIVVVATVAAAIIKGDNVIDVTSKELKKL